MSSCSSRRQTELPAECLSANTPRCEIQTTSSSLNTAQIKMIKAPIRGKRVSDGMHSLEVRCWWFVLRVGTQEFPVPVFSWKRDGTAVASELATEWSVTDGESELLIRNDGTINLSGPHPSERKQNLSLKLPDQALVGPARGLRGHQVLQMVWPFQ